MSVWQTGIIDDNHIFAEVKPRQRLNMTGFMDTFSKSNSLFFFKW